MITRLLIIIITMLLPLVAHADWQSDLEAVFDHVDTFDHYDDWTGEAADNSCDSYIYDNTAAPLYTAPQTRSEYWRQHCYYTRIGGTRPVAIDDHGATKRVGTKSIRFSHPGSGAGMTNGELNNVKTYFGDGTDDSGYSEVFIFFRMYLSKKAFPTYAYNDTNHTAPCYDLVNGYVRPCYVEGKDYAYLESWKWVAVNMGYINEAQFLDEAIDDNPCRWGLNEIHFHVAGGASQNYERRINLQADAVGTNIMGSVDITPFFDQLIGVEIHLKRESGKKAGDGLAEVTFYGSDGIGTRVLYANNINLVDNEDYTSTSNCWSQHTAILSQARVDTLKFNRVNFEANKRMFGTNGLGGNNYSGGLEKDPSTNAVIGDMENAWYVDDFIVDGSTIAASYYALLDGNIVCYPDADSDLYPGSGSEVVETCSSGYFIPSHFTAMTTDCDDTDADINPGETDVCGNSIDEDCSGSDATCDPVCDSEHLSLCNSENCAGAGGNWCTDVCQEAACSTPSASLKKWGGKPILSVTTQGD